MEDLGSMIGALMVGLIRARRIADEETAALAEYYRDNPLLEGLSVPRIRIPELTIDMPMVIEDHTLGETGSMNEPDIIANSVDAYMMASLAKEGVKPDAAFSTAFRQDLISNLSVIRQPGQPVMKESISRAADSALASSIARSGITISPSVKKVVAQSIRVKSAEVGIKIASRAPSIKANINTAQVKERADAANVVRLKVTFKEEGLEWTTQRSESGGVKNTLQPE